MSQRLERHTFLALVSAFFAVLGSFLFGYNTAVISGALAFIAKEFSLSTTQEGIIVSVILIGGLIGSLFAGTLADFLGRRRTIVYNAVLFIIGTWISMTAQSFDVLILGRIITGVAVGVISLTAPVYLAEISPSQQRGAFVSIHQLAITIGILGAYLVDYFFTASGSWRSMLGAAMIPSVAQLIGMLFLPESPSWYLARGQQMKAVHAFGLLRKDQGWRSHIQEIKNLAASKKEGSWKNFFKPSFRFALMVGILLSVFQQITGINTVIYYAPKIFQMAGYNNASSAIVASLAIGTINSMLTGFSVWILDRVGRKPLLLASVCGMLISLLCLSIAFFTHSTFIDLIAIISLMAYVGFFAIGMGPVTWVVLSEIYPLQMRGRAMGLAIFVNWLFNYFVSLTFLDLLQTLGVGGAFCFYAVICVIALWFVYRYIPETKGKSLEQIEKKLQSR